MAIIYTVCFNERCKIMQFIKPKGKKIQKTDWEISEQTTYLVNPIQKTLITLYSGR